MILEMGYTPNNLLFHRETDDKQGDFDDFGVAYQTNPNDLMVYMWNPSQMGRVWRDLYILTY